MNENAIYDWGVCSESEVYRDTTETNHICDQSDWANSFEDALKMACNLANNDGANYTIMKYYHDGGDCAWPEYLIVEPDGSYWCDNNNVMREIEEM